MRHRSRIPADVRHSLLAPILALCLLLTACSGGRQLDSSRLDDSFYLGGIQVNEPDHREWTAALEAAGMNTVATTVYAHQGAWNTDHLWFDETDEGVLHEIRRAKEAGLKVVLILRVALDNTYEENQHLWHGMIMPGTEEQLRSWFRRYADFVRSWGEIAQAEGVDVLGIGSELNALASTTPVAGVPVLEEYYLNPEKQEQFKQEVLAGVAAGAALDGDAESFESVDEFLASKVSTYETWAGSMTAGAAEDALEGMNARRAFLEELWLGLIEEVRQVYGGKLTYAANFDQYHEVGFWEHLDVIGINAYFPLRKRFLEDGEGDQLPGLLEAGWRGVLAGVESFRQKEGVTDRPVIFTELGYTERRDSSMAPWAGDNFTVIWGEGLPAAEGEAPPAQKRLIVWNQQPRDPAERVEAIAALRRVVQAEHPGLLKGILYWKLSTQPEHRDIEPFVAILGDDAGRPLVEELAGFRRPAGL